MTRDEWLAEVLSKMKPLTTAQRDVLIPAFKRAAAAAREQEQQQSAA